jgi:hypothetical protein
VPPPASPPPEIAHHGYEYVNCALPIWVSPSNAAAVRKNTMIGLRVIVPLPVVVLGCVHISGSTEEAK